MPCPQCGGNDLWDDNLWEGCNNCDYVSNGVTLVSTRSGKAVGGTEITNHTGNPLLTSAEQRDKGRMVREKRRQELAAETARRRRELGL